MAILAAESEKANAETCLLGTSNNKSHCNNKSLLINLRLYNNESNNDNKHEAKHRIVEISKYGIRMNLVKSNKVRIFEWKLGRNHKVNMALSGKFTLLFRK